MQLLLHDISVVAVVDGFAGGVSGVKGVWRVNYQNLVAEGAFEDTFGA